MNREVLAADLDTRISDHIARGNENVLNIIRTNHMDTIAQIRDYMLDVMEDLCDARAMNHCFYMAIAELNINLADLLEPVKCVKVEKNMKIAI